MRDLVARGRRRAHPRAIPVGFRIKVGFVLLPIVETRRQTCGQPSDRSAAQRGKGRKLTRGAAEAAGVPLLLGSSSGAWRRGVFRLRVGWVWLGIVAVVGAAGTAEAWAGGAGYLVILYVLPVGLATWLVNRRAGVAVAALSVGVTLAVGRDSGSDFGSEQWSQALVQFAALSSVVGLVEPGKAATRRWDDGLAQTRRIKREVTRLEKLEAEIVRLSTRAQGQLATEIHDELGQYISALSYQATMLAEDLTSDGSTRAARAEHLVELVRRTNRAVRQLGGGIQARDGFDGCFVEMLERLAVETERLAGVPCRVRCNRSTLTLDSFRAMMLYRIVQEACANAIKHGKPKAIAISLTVDGSSLGLDVGDHGGGFVVPDAGPGLGLHRMRQRAELIGGALSVQTADGGCHLRCALPLPTPGNSNGEAV